MKYTIDQISANIAKALVGLDRRPTLEFTTEAQLDPEKNYTVVSVGGRIVGTIPPSAPAELAKAKSAIEAKFMAALKAAIPEAPLVVGGAEKPEKAGAEK